MSALQNAITIEKTPCEICPVPSLFFSWQRSGLPAAAWLGRGEHVITEDGDREQVFKRVADFIAARTQ